MNRKRGLFQHFYATVRYQLGGEKASIQAGIPGLLRNRVLVGWNSRFPATDSISGLENKGVFAEHLAERI
jgi:hypothetical protein